MSDRCGICREPRGHGNNPYPLLSAAEEHRLCNQCNDNFVIPLRLGFAREPEAAVKATREINKTIVNLHSYDTTSFTYPPTYD